MQYPFSQRASTPETLKVGRVVSVNPSMFTVDVKLSDIGMLHGVPIINLYGTSHGRDLTWTTSYRGSLVILIRVGYEYLVLGTLPEQSGNSTGDLAVPVTVEGSGGGNSSTYGTGSEANFRSGRASDILSGDKILRTDGNAELSLFRDGVARLKASPLAQIILGKYKDFCRVVARRFQVFTDSCELESGQVGEGRVSTIYKGGADLATETHPNREMWTIRAWIGDFPDDATSRLHIRVNDSVDSEFCTLQLTTEGTISVETSKDFLSVQHRDCSFDIERNHTRNVEGTENITVSGDKSETNESNSSLSVLDNYTVVVGDTLVATAGEKVRVTSGSEVSVSSPKVVCSGDVDIGGDLKVSGHISGTISSS